MAARTGGNVVANIMDHLESTLVNDIGGLGSGAAINKCTVGGWFTSREAVGVAGHLALMDMRSDEAGGFTRSRVGRTGGERRFVPIISDGVGASAAHYFSPTDDAQAVFTPEMAVDKVWWVASAWDGSGGLTAPTNCDCWVYSPPAALGGEDFPLQKIVMKYTTSAVDFIQNLYKLCLGGWSGTVTTAALQSQCHDCEYQDWFFIPAILTTQQATDLASGKAASSVLANVAGRKVWSLRESAAPFKETFNSGDDLTAVGTVSVVSNFAGVTVMPFSVTAAHDGYLQSTLATSDFTNAATIRVGYNTGLTAKLRTYMVGTNLVTDHSCQVGGTIESAILNLQCTTGAAAARKFQVWRGLRAVIEDTGSAGGFNWDNYETYAPSAWATAGASGAGDATSVGATGNLDVPTTTGAKTFDITATIQACLDAGGDVRLLLIDENDGTINAAGGTTGIAQFSSIESATPWTIDVTYTAPTGGGAGGASSMRGRGRYRNRATMLYGG